MDQIRLPGQWAEWELTEYIGSGAYGTVYEAVRERDGLIEESAIKIIRVPLEDSDLEFMMREYRNEHTVRQYYSNLVDELIKEIKTMDALKEHPNIVAIQDYVVEENKDQVGWTIYIRMELLENLTDYFSGKKVQEKEVIKLGKDLCQALIGCEEHNILHRDIKPDNILVSPDGDYKLADFGVARQIEKSDSTVSIKGTFSYMAPEAFHGKGYSYNADVYSLGLVLYRMMNRHRDPFVDMEKQIVYHKDKEESLKRRMTGEEIPVPVDATPEFADIILHACEYQTEYRYVSAKEMLADLIKLEKGRYSARTRRIGSTLRGRNRKGKPFGKQDQALHRRKIGEAIAAAVVICGLISAGVWYTGAVGLPHQGSLNKNVNWSLSWTGVLTLTAKEKLTGNREAEVKSPGQLEEGGAKESFPWGRYRRRIRKVIFDNDVISIGERAFSNCVRLKAVTLPDNIESIEEEAFSECLALSEVMLPPDNEMSINVDAFFDTPWEKKQQQTHGGMLIVNDLLVTADSSIEEAHIPEGVKRINESAFEGIETLEKVTLPVGTKEIGSSAFKDCSNLSKIDIPESVTKAEGDSFFGTPWEEKKKKEHDGLLIVNDLLLDGDNTIKTLRVPEGIRVINCGEASDPFENVEVIYLPKSLQVIGDEAFQSCEHLRAVHFSEGLIRIGDFAFRGTEGIEEIRLPNSLKRIGYCAFDGCKKLETIHIPHALKSFGEDAFCDTPWQDKLKKRHQGFVDVNGILIDYPDKPANLTGTVIVPERIWRINDYAFADNSDIRAVILPQGLKSYGESPFGNELSKDRFFKDCERLRTVSFLGRRGIFTLTKTDVDVIETKKVIWKKLDSGLIYVKPLAGYSERWFTK